MERPDDEALIRSAQAGDRTALDQLLRRHHASIWGVCRRIAGNEADAADATQEALIAITRGLHRYDFRARFSTWAYRVATNACLDELRRRRRRPDPGLPEHERADDRALHASRPVDPVAAIDDRLDIDAALGALPLDFRAPIVLRDLLGCDYAEIAEILDIPGGTVRSRIARGRRLLAATLGNQTGLDQRPTRRP